ncbi:hypothetical protein D6745_01780 [Candidatus Woesearchaeota archaeon]|nr:MAG: hypothetical protein D6745_01780 [Candidatus Woesearchaeota archaeon]
MSSEEQEEKKQEKDSVSGLKIVLYSAIFIIILFVIAFSIRFFLTKDVETIEDLYRKTLAGEESENNYLYNGFAFVKVGPFWYTRIVKGGQPYDIPFKYDPKSLDDISVLVEPKDFNHSFIYLTMDPNLTSKTAIASIEVGRIIGNKYGIMNISTRAAITRPKEGISDDIPVVTCDDVTNETGVVLFGIGDITAVVAKNGCILVGGTDEEEIIRAADKLAYHILGIA